jgi:hypothetical protein
MTKSEAKQAMRLKDFCDMTLADGTSVLRMDEEFKFSPWGADNPDKDCFWLDRDEVRDIAS